MKTVIYPGSFDPLTVGHEDIIFRISKMFDKVLIGVLTNEIKHPMFTLEERIEIIKQSTKKLINVEVITFDKLLVDYVSNNNIDAIIKGIRNGKDFEEELAMAQGIKKYNNNVETLLLPTDPLLSYVSSSMVKSLYVNEGEVKGYVNDFIGNKLKSRERIAR